MESFLVPTPTYSGNHKGFVEGLPVLLALHAHTRVSRAHAVARSSAARLGMWPRP
jgi:hypothetical protein